MDRRCSVETCKREAETHCYHCSRDVCTTHYFEHKKSIQKRLPSFVDEVNLIYKRLRRRSDKKQAIPASNHLINVYNQLDQWRADSHQHIDIVYKRVRNQIESIGESQKHKETQKTADILKSLEKMREQLKELRNEGDVTNRQLETMKTQLEEIKKKDEESVNYPDIRIITGKIDVEKQVRVTTESRQSIEEQLIAQPTWFVPPKTKPSAQHPFPQWYDRGESYSSTSSSGNSISKCPVCFMVFPATMTPMEKEKHLDIHYTHL